MKNVSIDSPVAQKIVQTLLNKTIRDKFNLHPTATAKGIVEEAKKCGITAQEAFRFLKANLPGIVEDFLEEVGSKNCDQDGKRLDRD